MEQKRVRLLVNLEKNLLNKIDLQIKYDKMPPLLQSFVRSYFLGASRKHIQETMCLTNSEYYTLRKQMILILEGE